MHYDFSAQLNYRHDQQIVDVPVGIAHVSLLEQAGFLEELLELALDYFDDHSRRLAFGLRSENLALLLDDGRRYFFAPDAARIRRRHMHRKFLDELLERFQLRA